MIQSNDIYDDDVTQQNIDEYNIDDQLEKIVYVNTWKIVPKTYEKCFQK